MRRIERLTNAALRHCLAVLAALFLLSMGSALYAETVRPISAVVSNVNVRASPDTDISNVVGAIFPGQEAELLGDVPYFYRVRLPNGVEGFVSKRWTEVVSAADRFAFRVHVVDVGTGLAALVEGRDFALIYDAGSRDDKRTGDDNRMLAYLRHVRPELARIDHFIVSHAHEDHISLAPDIFENYDIGAVWDSGVVPGTCVYRNFLEAVVAEPEVAFHRATSDDMAHRVILSRPSCGRDGAPIETITIPTGSTISRQPVSLGVGAQMTFLYVDGRHHTDLNKNSLVVRLDLGEVRILMMGDAEAGQGRQDPDVTPTADSIEGALLACCAGDVEAQVLVVGHHGSRTSSRQRFLNAVDASDFIISSGPFPYHSVRLPDGIVVEELRGRGDVWLTTENDAACRIDPEKVGSDADQRPGGCSNVQLTVNADGSYRVGYYEGFEPEQ